MKLEEIKPLNEGTIPKGSAKAAMIKIEKAITPLFKGLHFSVRTSDVTGNEKYMIRIEFANTTMDDRVAIGKKDTMSTSIQLGAFNADGEPYNEDDMIVVRPMMSSKNRKIVKAMREVKSTTVGKAVDSIINYFKKNADKLKGE